MRVLILGGRAPVALDHARRFAAQGWTVHIADSAPCRISSWSRAVRSQIRLPAPRHFLPRFAAELRKAIEAARIDLVLPTCEEVFYLSRIRHLLPSSCNVFVAPFEQLRDLHSKWAFLELARDCGVTVPAAAHVSNLDSAREWAQGRAVVLKPEFSRFGVHVRIYPAGITADATALAPLGRWVVQEFQRGTEICSYSVAVAGQVRAHVAYRPVYRIARSSSYYFDRVAMPRIQAFVARFVARLGFSGQISFDWIADSAGTLAVLECNPRAISGLHLFNDADELPAVISGQAATCIEPAGWDPRMIGGVMLAVGLPSALRAGTFRTWHADWSRATDVLSASNDPLPPLGGLLDIASFLRLAMQNGSTMRAAATRDIEWDGDPLDVLKGHV